MDYFYSRFNLNKFNIIFSFLISVILIILIACFSKFGFDITDEGYYFNSISNPRLYGIGITNFGYIYNFFYIFFGKNFFYLREFNLFLILFFSWVLLQVLFKIKLKIFEKKNILNELLISSLSFAGLIYIFPYSWLITPSYNSLNFQGLLITSIGLILITNVKNINTYLGYILLGFGGFILICAKPTTAFFLGIIIFFYLCFIRYINFRLLLLSFFVLFFLFFLFFYITTDSFNDVFRNFISSFYNYNNIASRSIFRLDWYSWTESDLKFFILIFLLMSCILLKSIDISKKMFFIFKYILLFYVIYLCFNIFGIKKNLHIFELDLLVFPVFAIIVILYQILIEKQLLTKSKELIYLGFYFLFLPYIFAFGTSNAYWYQAQLVVYFWVLSSFCFLVAVLNKKNALSIIALICVILQVLIICFVTRSLKMPYRQESFLNFNHYKYYRINKNTGLNININLIQCVDEIKRQMNNKGFLNQTPLIDMTGHSPGMVFLLHGKAVGNPWVLDINKEIQLRMLGQGLKQPEKTWFLFNDKNQITNARILLKKLHINFVKDYELVVQVKCKINIEENEKTIMIFKPKNFGNFNEKVGNFTI